MFNFVEGFAVQVADKMQKGADRLTEDLSNGRPDYLSARLQAQEPL